MSNQNGSDTNARLPTLLNSEKPPGSAPSAAQPKMPNRNETASSTSIPTAPQDYKYQQANAQSPNHSIPSLNIPINPMYGQIQQQYRYYNDQYQYYGQQQNYPYYMYNQQYPYNYYQQTQRGQVPQQLSASVIPTQNGQQQQQQQQQPPVQQSQPPQIQPQPQSQPPVQSQPSLISHTSNPPQQSQQQTPQQTQVPIQQPQQHQQHQQQQLHHQQQNQPSGTPQAPQRMHVLPQPPLQNDLNLNSGSTVGQYQPPGVRPRVTTTMWEDEKTLCYQVDANNVSVVRRADNNMINGTKLLNVAEMTRGRRDGILKLEKVRHVVKIGSMHLKGVWIPFERALAMAQREGIVDLLYPLFVRDIKRVIQTGITPNKTANYYDNQTGNNSQAQQSPVSQSNQIGTQSTSQQTNQTSRQYPLPTPNEPIQNQAGSNAAPVYGYQQYYPPSSTAANPTGQYYYNGFPYNNQMYSHYQYAKPKDELKPEKKE